jgi:signal transduction histidine kinase
MGMPASAVITGLSVALVLLTYRKWRGIASSVALASLSATSLSLVGYLFGASQLYSIPKWTGIALQTAAGLAALSIGVISLVREHGLAEILLRPDAGGRMFRLLVLPVVGIAISLGFARVLAQEYGYVDSAFGTAMRSIIEIALLMGLLWWTAERLSQSEAASRDASRSRAENETYRRIAWAQESERRRIARDVHDHIGQQVTGLRLRLESLCLHEGIDKIAEEEVRGLRDQAMNLDSDLSLLVWQMRPSVLDSHGLASALNSFIREWSANHKIECEFQAPSPDTRLSPDIETNLYRIIQEALNNILKHAGASRVSVTMNYIGDEAVLLIEDNGAGFDPDPESIHTTEGSGFGLIGMKERAALIGGTLEIESRAGTGTAIMVRIPNARRLKAAASSSP